MSEGIDVSQRFILHNIINSKTTLKIVDENNMKLNIPFPDEKISWFKDRVEISDADFRELKKHSHLFIENKSNRIGTKTI